MKPISHLRLVPFRENDFSLGEIFKYEHGTQLTGESEINATISLITQWPELSRVLIFQDNKIIDYEAKLTCDPEEASPTELYISTEREPPLRPFQEIRVCVELFSTSYEFFCTILSVSKPAKHLLVISIPQFINVLKIRRVPRSSVEKASPQINVEIDGVAKLVVPIEVGVSSIVFSSNLVLREGQEVRLRLDQTSIRCQPVRYTETGIAFRLEFESVSELKAYFSYYISIRFRTLRFRAEENYDALFATYLESGYLSKFLASKSPDELDQIKAHIISTWRKIDNTSESPSFDIVSFDENGHIVGACSLSASFLINGIEAWSLQQLCVNAVPKNFQNTYELYTWRAEIAGCLSEDTPLVCWYDSKSRWLDRLWTRFANRLESSDSLKVVDIRTLTAKELDFISSDKIAEFSLRTIPLGEPNREVAEGIGWFFGIGPRYLNASAFLDLIQANSETSFSDALAALFRTMHERKIAFESIKIAFEGDAPDLIQSFQKHPSDRYCRFRADEAALLFASLQHSMAVMAKKEGVSLSA